MTKKKNPVTFFVLFLWTFSRVVVVPLKKIKKKEHALANCLSLQTRMNEILPGLVKSVGVIIERQDDFKHTQNDAMFKEVIETIEQAAMTLDLCTQCNYARL